MQLAGHPLQEGVIAQVEKGSRSGTPSNHGHGCGIRVELGRFVSWRGLKRVGLRRSPVLTPLCPLGPMYALIGDLLV